MEGDDSLVARQLFGGAMSIEIPRRFVDVSQFREVPDNQEVFADGSTDQSFIIELLELAQDTPNDQAAKFHFNVIAAEGAAVSAQVEGQIKQQDVMDGVANRTIATGLQQVGKHRDNPAHVNLVHLYVACLRVFEVNTDIVVSMNSPTFIDQGSSVSKDVDPSHFSHFNAPHVAEMTFHRSIETFNISDWSIFG
eukprot:gene3524-6142_t